MSIGSVTFTDCPTSGFFAMIVTVPSSPIRTKALNFGSAGAGRPWARAAGST